MKPVSMNDSAYCKARSKLDCETLRELCLDAGKRVEEESSGWKWKGRNVYLADGTVISAADTKENQHKFPQLKRQKAGLGFPKIRVMGLFGLSSGAMLDIEVAPYSGKNTGEPNLLRKIVKRLQCDDILILDRFFTSYFIQELLQRKKIDYVIRARDRMAQRLLGKKKSKIVMLKRPSKSGYSGDESYKELATEIRIKIVKSTIERKGFKTATIYLMTSLINGQKYSVNDVEKIYIERWHVELDIRNLKCTLDVKFLKCKTPSMVFKELWVKILAHNLIRKILVTTANTHLDYGPRKRSFKTTKSLFINVLKVLGAKSFYVIISLLKTEVLNSKYRKEPRAVKYRNDRYHKLTCDRKLAKDKNFGTIRKRANKASKQSKPSNVVLLS
ncbi:MAG: IS4 family transposase [Bacteriovoracaceae bacterium]|nr:IS4 family transposase [Bacteriovoracaceae bacterium]